MIHEVLVRDPTRTPCKWWPTVKWLKEPGTTLKFGPGLTIIFGPNGCGKSTLIRTLAQLFHCAQSGRQVVTQDSMREVVDRGKTLEAPSIFLDGLDVKHDGAPISHFDADHRAGLIGGMAAFDFDFMSEGMANIQAGKLSAGQGHITRLNSLFGNKPKPLENRVKHYRDEVPKHDADALAFLKSNMEGPAGPPTMLLDEPDRSLSMKLRFDLWSLFKRASKTHQIIVATHDPLALFVKDATFVEPEAHYVEECRFIMMVMEDPAKAKAELVRLEQEVAKKPKKKSGV